MTTQTNNIPNPRIQERIRQLKVKIWSRKDGSQQKTGSNEFEVRNYEGCTIWVRVK